MSRTDGPRRRRLSSGRGSTDQKTFQAGAAISVDQHGLVGNIGDAYCARARERVVRRQRDT
jgi:hypothetical protein